MRTKDYAMGLKVVAIIPARGGSKGIPGKNIKLFNGEPLIAHTIRSAQNASKVDAVFVSTDSPEIARIAEKMGALTITRPEILSSDEASSESALSHALQHIETQHGTPDLVVFLQATSPIRQADDIDNAIDALRSDSGDSLVSVSPNHRFLWRQTENGAEPINYDHRKRPRRQDMEQQFVENGSIYVFKPWVLKQDNNRLGGHIVLYPMSEAAAWEIDSLLDWQIAETLMKKENTDVD
jgi:N-acylneuraminate cytidylyltransferase